MATQHFFIRGKHYGSASRGQVFAHERRTPAYGYGFFCPICCELWASCPIEGEPATVHSIHCDRHTAGDKYGNWSQGQVSSYHIPGSILLSYDQTWNDSLPDSLLAREFLLHYPLTRKDLP